MDLSVFETGSSAIPQILLDLGRHFCFGKSAASFAVAHSPFNEDSCFIYTTPTLVAGHTFGCGVFCTIKAYRRKKTLDRRFGTSKYIDLDFLLDFRLFNYTNHRTDLLLKKASHQRGFLFYEIKTDPRPLKIDADFCFFERRHALTQRPLKTSLDRRFFRRRCMWIHRG